MEFNWINIFAGIIVALMLIPNLVFAAKNKEKKPEKANIIVRIFEQISRYACIILMILPLFVWEFGFSRPEFLPIYIIGNVILLVLYYIFWGLFFKGKTFGKAIALAIIPSLIFILSAVSVNHPALLVAAVIFAASHICITWVENKR